MQLLERLRVPRPSRLREFETRRAQQFFSVLWTRPDCRRRRVRVYSLLMSNMSTQQICVNMHKCAVIWEAPNFLGVQTPQPRHWSRACAVRASCWQRWTCSWPLLQLHCSGTGCLDLEGAPETWTYTEPENHARFVEEDRLPKVHAISSNLPVGRSWGLGSVGERISIKEFIEEFQMFSVCFLEMMNS